MEHASSLFNSWLMEVAEMDVDAWRWQKWMLRKENLNLSRVYMTLTCGIGSLSWDSIFFTVVDN